jgi:integrase/recombinase XerC
LINLEQLICEWQLKLSTLNRSINTIKAYSQDFFDFKFFYNDYHNTPLTLENFKKVTVQDIRAWLLYQRKKGMNTRSSARGLAGLRSFTQFLLSKQILEDHAFFHSRSPKLQKTLPRPVSIEQALVISHTIQNMSENEWVGLRNQSLMQLLYYTGMRISEALNLNQGCLNGGQFITVMGKGKKARQVPIIDSIRQGLIHYLKLQPFENSLGAPLFYGEKGKRLQATIAQKVLRDFRRAQGMPESLTPHALRHSCATHLMQSSHDLRGIQELLGHASLSSTQIYTQLDELSMMNTYKIAHPRARKI